MWRKMVTLGVVLIFVSAAEARVVHESLIGPAGNGVSKAKVTESGAVESLPNEVKPGNSPFKPANLGAKENLGDSVWAFDAQTPTGDNQILGVEFDGTYFWLTGANSGSDPNKLYKLDCNGNLVETYDQPSHATGWGLRDLAWDGQYLYGSASNTISIIDPATGQEIGTMTGPESPNRALAYDPATDHFWTANFSNPIYEFDRNGNVINTYSNSYSIYGAAWDYASPDGPWLWIAAQEDNGAGGYNYIYQFDPRTGTYTGVGFPVVYSSPDGYAGGLAFTTDWDHSKALLFEVIQGTPDVVVGLYVAEYGDSLDPLPPSNLTAYSDYTTPTEIALSWNDPTHYVGGDTLTDFHIEIWMAGETKDTTLLDTVSAGVEQYTATGLTDGTLYTFLVRAVDVNDSTSGFASVSWYAGGSPYPAPPHDLTATVLDDSTVELTWINPSTQSDGTPLDDLAGINIYVDGSLFETYATSDTGALITYDVIVAPGRRSFYVTAIDNETPQHESDPSNVVEVVTNVHAGGPDGYGYTFIDSDHSSGPDFIWVDASVGTPYSLGDDDNVLVNLPFPFPFYDQTLDQIYVVSNGFLTSTNTRDFSNDPLPDNSKDNIIAPFWDDLNPNNGGTIYTYYDANGTGAFVIEWQEVPHFGSGGPYTFEVMLYPNGDIVFSYLSMASRLGESTIGIQGGDGSNDYYLQYTYNGDPLTTHDSLTVLFQRPGVQHDVGVTAVEAPVGNYVIGDTVVPSVVVANVGQATETFDVVALITATDVIYGDTVNVTVDPGNTAEVTFMPFVIPSAGSYTFTAYTTLAGDENPNNDTASSFFIASEYLEDFENTNGGFMADPATGAWEWGTPTSGPGAAHSGVNVWATVLGGEYSNNADWKLYTPCYVATTDNPVFSFWHWFDIEHHYDGGNVAISTDGGATWTLVVPEGGYPDSNIVGLGEAGFTGMSGGWQMAVFHLDGISAGTSFCIRFRFGSDSSVTHDGWYIDDFAGVGMLPAVEETPIHDGLSFRLLGSSVNPVRSISDIMFSVPKRTAVRIELYDAAGRKVNTLAEGEFDAGVHSVKLDASHLANGVYFVRMTAGDFNAVRKVTVLK